MPDAASLIVRLDPFSAEPRLLTVAQVAAVLSCTPTHIGGLIRCGKLAAFNFAGDPQKRGLYRIHPLALEKFLNDALAS